MYSYQDWEGLKPRKFKDMGRKRFQLAAPEIITPRMQHYASPQSVSTVSNYEETPR